MKNLDRMKLEVNKRIEQSMLDIIKILDTMGADSVSKETLDDDDDLRVISTETILKASAIATEDVDEAIKARFLARLVKEYRRNRERAKQEQLREQMEREIEMNIFKRFPSLTNSPERTVRRTQDSVMRGKGSNSPPLNTSNNNYASNAKGKAARQAKGNNSILEGSFSMKQGWGTQASADPRKKVPGKKAAPAKRQVEATHDQDWIGAE